jgi:ABC-type transporter Mla MlaB component
MPWTVDEAGGCTRLTLTGAVAVADARSLHHTVLALAAATAPVHVDVADCRDLDSAALQLLLALRRAREAAGRPFVVQGATGRVERLLTRFLKASAHHDG